MNATTQNAINLAARILLAHIFILAGISKIMAYAGTQSYMESTGIPGAMLPLVILLELGCGLALIVGWQTRLAAAALAVFSIATAAIFHSNFADQTQMILFMKNFAMAGGLALIVAYGAGSLSVDAKLGQRGISTGSGQLKQA